MIAADRGIWSYTTQPMPADLYSYYFMIDGKPDYDRANPLRKPVVTGGYESLAHVPGTSPRPWEEHGAPQGTLRRHAYHSPRFGETRDVWVYAPHGYDPAGPTRYPVLYLLHGVMDDAAAWSTAGRVPITFDNLLAAGLIEPMLVVMPLGYGFPDARSRAREMLSPATRQRDVMDAFAGGLVDEVVTLVEREYRARPEPSARAIAGLSMGGAQALFIGLTRDDVFGSVASFSGAYMMYGGQYETWFGEIGGAPLTAPRVLTLSVGRDDFLAGNNRQFAAWLASRGAAVDLDEVAGAHTWGVWRRELIRLAPQLFR
jgi:enterochelin esterase family protein